MAKRTHGSENFSLVNGRSGPSLSVGYAENRLASRIPQLATLLLLPADVAEHIRMDVQTDIGH
ncbi:MAG TPA: hypothetical protein VGP28_06600, partial [Methylocella sp.]|nr:hypothetical protein [Methylocella sp.]